MDTKLENNWNVSRTVAHPIVHTFATPNVIFGFSTAEILNLGRIS